jgi:hypothetical protein
MSLAIAAGKTPDVFAAPRMTDQNIGRRDVRRGEERMKRLGDMRQRGALTIKL